MANTKANKRLGNGRCLNPEFSRTQKCSGAENQVLKDRVDRSSAETVASCLLKYLQT